MNEKLIEIMILIRFILLVIYFLAFGKINFFEYDEKRKREKRYSSNSIERITTNLFYIVTLILFYFLALYYTNNETAIIVLFCISLVMFPLDFIIFGITYIEISQKETNLIIKFMFIKRRYPISELRYKKGKIFLSLYHNNKKILILFEWLMEVNFEYFCIKKKE